MDVLAKSSNLKIKNGSLIIGNEDDSVVYAKGKNLIKLLAILLTFSV